MKKIVLTTLLSAMLMACGGEPETKTESVEEPQKAEQVEAATQAENNAPTFDFDFATYRDWVNADLKEINSDNSVPKDINFDGGDQAVNHTATFMFNDDFGFVASKNPTTDKLNSILVMISASDDQMKTLESIIEGALLVSATGGENGNKEVGGEVIKMVTEAAQEFQENPSSGVNKKMTKNGIDFSVQLTQGLPIMLSASPVAE